MSKIKKDEAESKKKSDGQKQPSNKDLFYKTESFWKDADQKTKKKVFDFNDKYIDFLTDVKTEFESVEYGLKHLKKAGFKDIKSVKNVRKGDKLYFNYKNRALFAYIVTEETLENGFKIVSSHIDSPRLDLKMRPLVEKDGMAFFKTHYYGGIKKYQWVTRPLAIHGFVMKKNGKKVKVLIGEDENGPVLTILDLLPHLAEKQMKKKASKIIEGEELQVLLGSIPTAKGAKSTEQEENEKVSDRVKLTVLKLLLDKYGIKEEDLISADLRIVPAGRARSLGVDGSMILAYGQDDRVCAYTSLQAFLELADSVEADLSATGSSEKENIKGVQDGTTPMMIWVDKEEIGSEGSTGAKGLMIRHALSLFAESVLGVGNLSETKFREILFNSKALSSDVDALINPVFPEVMDKDNAARLGHGGILIKYTGHGGKYFSSEALSEYMAYIRKVFDDADVFWQVGSLGKVDEGGGGTIAMYLANLGVMTVDFGTGLLAMHAPMEISSKADVYSTYKAYVAFWRG